MSEELVQLVEKGYKAWNAGDRGWVLDHMSPDVEWITPEADPDPGTYRGHQGVEEYWAQWRAAVGQLNFLIEEMLDAGDDVVVLAHVRAKTRRDGVVIEHSPASVWTIEDGKVKAMQAFADKKSALRALAEERAPSD
jgi:ketosteroid isomerase-like protein